ncbi:MAG: eL32 family ribosomal protein [Candidatus Micrarchaeia archaeon]|jgi:large subunit ribosomal protein L32e
MTEEIRKKKKGHPRFKRPNVDRSKRSRLADKWKKPSGQGNKQRQRLNQAGKWPTIGYKNSKTVYGVHPCGLKEIIINNIKEVENASKDIAIRIGGKVGELKRIKIKKIAKEKGIKVLN